MVLGDNVCRAVMIVIYVIVNPCVMITGYITFQSASLMSDNAFYRNIVVRVMYEVT
jgi:hypothetical protein